MARLPALIVLLVLGVLSLPTSAALFDGPGTENWILPIQLGAMAAIGAVVGLALPLAPAGSTPLRRVLVGAAWGVGMAIVGVVLFWFLLNGIRGA
jgi:hypothetical protein